MPGQQELHIELQTVDQLPSIFDFLFEQKIKLVNFKREEPSLEDAFIELTKRA
jgi:transglutaminase/protease-like cytokinesis protein 3